MLVRRPWDFDVMVTENMSCDILSDLTAGLVGGMGMAPSADIGDTPCGVPALPQHRPHIMGKGLAHPSAMTPLRDHDAIGLATSAVLAAL
jgi:3-isopropylmalate dehydrogenase